jgi:NAD(P)-dependent dehydrogenase (short-subunit alcohol dehydrogenase family)
MQDSQIKMGLEGKKAFISGATRGLGLAIAKSFLNSGVDVSFCGRNSHDVEEIESQLKSTRWSIGARKIVGITADVSDIAQVKNLQTTLKKNFGDIDILVCNAGVLGPINPFLSNDLDKWVSAFNVNLLGSIFLAHEFLPQMIAKGKGKMIQLSGGGAASPLPGLSSYAASKAAVVRFVETLAEEYIDSGVDINAVAPGMLKTRMLQEMLEAGPDSVGVKLFNKSLAKDSDEADSRGMACGLINFLASDISDGITGKLISAEWDKWSEWPQHIKELRDSDLYTLRRITGRDRNQTWGDA